MVYNELPYFFIKGYAISFLVVPVVILDGAFSIK